MKNCIICGKSKDGTICSKCKEVVDKIPVLQDGEWVRPDRKGWIHECCGCGLQHKVSFKLHKWFKKKIIYMKWEII